MAQQDNIQAIVNIDSRQAINQLGALELQASELNQELKNSTRYTEDYATASKKLEATRKRMASLQLDAKVLNERLEGMTKDTNAYITTSKKLERVKKRLADLKENAKGYQKQMGAVKKETEAYTQAATKLKRVEQDIEGMRKQLGTAGMTLRQLKKAQKDYNEELENLTPGTRRYTELQTRLQAINTEITRQKGQLIPVKNAWGEIKQEMIGVSPALLIAGGLRAGVQYLSALTKQAGKLSDQLADVAKNTGLSVRQVEELYDQLAKIRTRSSQKELLGLAQIAGKLGVKGKANILAFVEAADKINVALREDLGGNAEEAIRQLGKLVDLFGLKDKFGLEQGMLKIGSAINTLGSDSTTNEAFLVDFTKRLGPLAKNAKIVASDVLGLAATVDILGGTSEEGSSAVNKLFTDMAKHPENFASFARNADGSAMSVKAFTELLNRDANAAFLSFLKGLGENSRNLTEFAENMGELDQEGKAAVNVLASLSKNTELLEEQQQLANKAFEEGTSILEEFNTKNENFQAKLERIGKRLKQIFLNDTLLAGLDKVASAFDRLLEQPVEEKIEEQQLAFQLLQLQLARTKEGTEERIALMKELRATYGQYISGIKEEDHSNLALQQSLEQVNEKLRIKAELMLKEQQLREVNEEYQAKKEQVATATTQSDTQLNALQKEDGKTFDSSSDRVTQVTQAIDYLKEHRSEELGYISSGGFNNPSSSPTRLQAVLNQLVAQKKVLEVEVDTLERLNKKRNELADQVANLRAGVPANQGQQSDVTTQPDIPSSPDKKVAAPDTSGFEKYVAEIQQLQADFNGQLLSKEEQHAIKLLAQKEAQEAKLQEFLEQGVINQTQYREQLLAVDQLYADELGAILGKQANAEAERQANIQGLVEVARQESQSVQEEGGDPVSKAEEKYIAEEERVNRFYENLLQSARDYYAANEEIELIEEERQLAIEELKKQKEEEEQLVREETEVGLEVRRSTGFSRQLLEIEQFYREKEKLLRKNGATEAQITALNEQKTNEKRRLGMNLAAQTAQNTFSALSGMAAQYYTYYGESEEERIDYQIKQIKAQTLFDTAAAISGAVRFAMNNPWNSATAGAAGAIQLGVQLGTIALNIANASKQIQAAKDKKAKLKASPAPSFSGVGAGKKLAGGKAFYHGGFTPSNPLGIGGDENGPFTGFVHADEYVLSKAMLKDPNVRMATVVGEAIRLGNTYSNGGQAGRPSTDSEVAPIASEAVEELGVSSDAELLQEIKLLRLEVQELKNRPVIAMIEKDSFREGVDHYTEDQALENEVKLS